MTCQGQDIIANAATTTANTAGNKRNACSLEAINSTDNSVDIDDSDKISLRGGNARQLNTLKRFRDTIPYIAQHAVARIPQLSTLPSLHKTVQAENLTRIAGN